MLKRISETLSTGAKTGDRFFMNDGCRESYFAILEFILKLQHVAVGDQQLPRSIFFKCLDDKMNQIISTLTGLIKNGGHRMTVSIYNPYGAQPTHSGLSVEIQIFGESGGLLINVVGDFLCEKLIYLRHKV